MKRAIVLVVMGCMALAGCMPPPPPEAKPGEPPKTKADMMNEMRPILDPLRASVEAGQRNPDAAVTQAERQTMMAGIRGLQQKYGQEPFAQEAFREMGQTMKDLARTAADNENWENAAAGIDLFELLNLDSPSMRLLNAETEKNIGRPKVVVKGFYGDEKKGGIFVFFETTDRRTGKVKTYSLRENETTADLRVVKIVGDNMLVRFEYLPIPGLFFEVKGPRHRPPSTPAPVPAPASVQQ